MVGLSREVAYINKRLKNKSKFNVSRDGLLITWLMLYNRQIHHKEIKANYTFVEDEYIYSMYTGRAESHVTYNTLKSFKKYCRNNKLAKSYGKFVRTLPINERMNVELKIKRYREYLGLIK